jgi:hypothetical protein
MRTCFVPPHYQRDLLKNWLVSNKAKNLYKNIIKNYTTQMGLGQVNPSGLWPDPNKQVHWASRVGLIEKTGQ